MKRGFLLAVALLFVANRAVADDVDAAPTDRAQGCVESIPQGAVAPKIVDVFPEHGWSGYAAILRVEVEHGRGETVLPRGLELQSESAAMRALKEDGFLVPEPDAGASMVIALFDAGVLERARTRLEIPIIPAAKESGRHAMTLPSFPIAVSRASGEVMVVCTKSHVITVDDPTASIPNATPRTNGPPLPQREEWTALKRALQWTLVGIVLGALAMAVYAWWRRRPVPAPPPPPPRPAWEVAFEKLDQLRRSGLFERREYSAYYDKVSDILREYLGGRYGFVGLESTTREIMTELRRRAGPELPRTDVQTLLDESDLIKFARMTPSAEECQRAHTRILDLVHVTRPMPRPIPNLTPGRSGAA